MTLFAEIGCAVVVRLILTGVANVADVVASAKGQKRNPCVRQVPFAEHSTFGHSTRAAEWYSERPRCEDGRPCQPIFMRTVFTGDTSFAAAAR
jgi:hypothetical protein